MPDLFCKTRTRNHGRTRNHINFRHLPIIAEADEFEGAIILVSHVPEFVDQISIDQVWIWNCLKNMITIGDRIKEAIDYMNKVKSSTPYQPALL